METSTQDNEFITGIKKTIESYEKMKEEYSDQMSKIKSRIDSLIENEHYSYSSPRITHLTNDYDNMAAGLSGICDYIEALEQRIEAMKNDPDNVDNCRYTI